MVAPLLISGGIALAKAFLPDLIGSIAGEKAESVAKTALEVGEQLTGKSDPQEIEQALKADPNLVLEFKTRVMQHVENMYAMELKGFEDARKRDIEVRKLNAGKNVRANWMIAGDVIGLIVCLVAIWQFPVDAPGELRGLLISIASYFGLGLRDAHQFEFGSSRGSKEKSELMGSK